MIDHCQCHGKPLSWCPQYRVRPVADILLLRHPAQGTGVIPPVGPDDIPHRGTGFPDGSYTCDWDCPGWHDGTVVHAPEDGMCGVCGDPYCDGELVVKLPMPCLGFPYAHCTDCQPEGTKER